MDLGILWWVELGPILVSNEGDDAIEEKVIVQVCLPGDPTDYVERQAGFLSKVLRTS